MTLVVLPCPGVNLHILNALQPREHAIATSLIVGPVAIINCLLLLEDVLAFACWTD
jgi:hypothetical protein